MEQHADEVFIWCPVVRSPTVSAVFPLTAGLFDLVIFDEASSVLRRIRNSAIYRAQQTVIVGEANNISRLMICTVYGMRAKIERAALEVNRSWI